MRNIIEKNLVHQDAGFKIENHIIYLLSLFFLSFFLQIFLAGGL